MLTKKEKTRSNYKQLGEPILPDDNIHTGILWVPHGKKRHKVGDKCKFCDQIRNDYEEDMEKSLERDIEQKGWKKALSNLLDTLGFHSDIPKDKSDRKVIKSFISRLLAE